MPSIKIRDGGGSNRMMGSGLSKEAIVVAIGSAVESAEKGHDVELTINQDNIEVFVNADAVSE
jgi:hypothetical protein